MKKSIKLNIVVLLTAIALVSCKKEAALTPTTEKEMGYGSASLPQGNHDYDAVILEKFKKYGTLFLYKFTNNDLYYNVNTYIGGGYDTAKNKMTRPGYFHQPVNESYVGQQLQLLDEIWLRFYPDEFLKKTLPSKVYLVDSFYYSYNYYLTPGAPRDYIYYEYEVYNGVDYLLATWGGERVTTITAADKFRYKGLLNALFLKLAINKNFIKQPAGFTSLTNYNSVEYGNFIQMGVIDYYRRTPSTDFEAYIEMIVSNSYTQLTAPGNKLHPGTDTSGLIRKKYEQVLQYFLMQFNIDLQAIGNAGA